MKIAITAKGQGQDSEIDPRFGRASQILIYDITTQSLQALDNSQNALAAQGAGIQAARSIVQAGVEALITGHVGPKAFTVLQAAQIHIYQMPSGTVADAIKAFQSGKLQVVAQPDVLGHKA